MADVSVPSIVTATPAATETVLGITSLAALKRFSIQDLVNAGVAAVAPSGGVLALTGSIVNTANANRLALGATAAFDNFARIIGATPKLELWHDGDSVGRLSYSTGVLTYGTHAGNGSVTAKLSVDASGNLGLSTSTFGTSAAGVFAVKNGTAPTTGPADTVQFYSSDDAAGHTIPSFFCEGTNVLATGQADSASSVRVKVRINGTVVTLLAI